MLDAVCLDINGRLTANTAINSLLSGSTGIIVLLHNEYIVCGNVGDSRAGLVRLESLEDHGSLVMLSRDHTPVEPDERDRILQAGGKIMPCIGRSMIIRSFWISYRTVKNLGSVWGRTWINDEPQLRRSNGT